MCSSDLTLVDDDEEQLIVFIREGRLKIEEFLDLEIGTVISCVVSAHVTRESFPLISLYLFDATRSRMRWKPS